MKTPFVPGLCKIKWLAVSTALSAALPLNAAAQTNLLINPGFESGNLNGWSTFGANNYVQSTGGYAHSGTYYYKVYGNFNGTQNYTGIYQYNSSAPGDTYSANGWAFSLSSDDINGEDQIWIEVSFLDSSYNALALYRSAVVTSANIASFGGYSTWFDLQITNQCSYTNASALILLPGTVTNTVSTLVAPPATAYVRYQVVFAQGPDNANGSMYFDDLTLNQTGGTMPSPLQWNIVWSDEFNGTSINANNWTYDLGGGGWGNGELEYYTSSLQNAYVSNGVLNIVAMTNSTYGITSARMKSEGLYNTPVYGRFEWRAKLPAGSYLWPALWMLGSDYTSVGWPACGEIDVVENNGATPTWVQGSLHWGTSGEVSETATYNFPSGGSVTNWHIYDLVWTPGQIQFSVDGNIYETQSVGAPFNAPFFFIMNLAVGGNYVGSPTNVAEVEASTTFPAVMQVDYVRVYEQTAPLAISVAPQPDGSLTLSWPTNIVCHLQVQTNSIVGGNWSDLPVTTSPYVVIPDPTQSAVFYRLESP